MKFDIAYYTNIGKRADNQDSYAYRLLGENLVACIADGVGGQLGGSIASRLSTQYFINNIDKNADEDKLHNLLSEINSHILNQAVDENYGMATTFTGVIIKNKIIIGAHTGDTRVCILRGNGIKQLTNDHTEIARLLKEGLISFEDSLSYPRRNIIESALGIRDEFPRIDNFTFDLEYGDRIILTTDGVHENVSKRDLRDISLKSKTSNQFVDILSEYLLIKEPSDNNTFIVITIHQ
ncbi:hypothetical protein AM493_02945 [Flavobacterium akiainvivens]|uniref:PPM-type phosphatase domain-containing protein n=1 Tax=Flavobacterium akiainvivens TaxID=1202724 RepID=A0A0M9VHA8_9FLAO|nr:PP2C family serine/threonine-protein phosphatase [Flavobacterium akiainvivens]KOS05109.1 hypothetical protein AM493_02945 [Flavobacterium akiainvivens]SFQ51565.1 protein phosphatase [Flavobacterium akiainvivens]